MFKDYTAPEAELLEFRSREKLAEDNDFIVEATGDYDGNISLDDLLKPKG